MTYNTMSHNDSSTSLKLKILFQIDVARNNSRPFAPVRCPAAPLVHRPAARAVANVQHSAGDASGRLAGCGCAGSGVGRRRRSTREPAYDLPRAGRRAIPAGVASRGGTAGAGHRGGNRVVPGWPPVRSGWHVDGPELRDPVAGLAVPRRARAACPAAGLAPHRGRRLVSGPAVA